MSAPEDARSTVMGRIRASLGVASLDRARKASVERRLERHPRGTIPARAKRGRAECVALFTEMLAAQGGDVRHILTRKEAVAAIASYLGTCNLPPRIRMGAGTQSLPRCRGATPGTSSARSDRPGQPTGPLYRAPSWPRPRPELCSWCQAPKIRPR